MMLGMKNAMMIKAAWNRMPMMMSKGMNGTGMCNNMPLPFLFLSSPMQSSPRSFSTNSNTNDPAPPKPTASHKPLSKKLSSLEIIAHKRKGKKLAMITAYDFPTVRIRTSSL